MARGLEATGDYKVLRRLVPREPSASVGPSERVGLIIDLETTGLDTAKDEVIELAAIKFRYDQSDAITGVTGIFQAFNQPSGSIPAEVTRLTGITDEMVAGCKIDADALVDFVADAGVVIAHNAGFDRKFAERFWPTFETKNWACSASQVDWKAHGFGGAKLAYLLSEIGLFHNAHRAIDDCHALLEVLAHPLPTNSASALAELLDRARRRAFRIWAENAPFDLKEVLKKRGYRWSDGSDGSPRAWHIEVDESIRETELDYLRREIYQRDIDLRCQAVTARERFSARR
ncbi:3'-5' exonuclease [Pseudolabrys taiwanensis]|uniref:3'-5' exonuclease n=2 Tax=Pseudolabrys taiwanensis TaxID=331696 RepID=A0A345ZR50_9HYPH|nr:3'-5' exonuclease [Pseudolabrys taiwanensis]AXK79397.1 3'-5' exonuclease [Pseudolabrys taiwanensis]